MVSGKDRLDTKTSRPSYTTPFENIRHLRPTQESISGSVEGSFLLVTFPSRMYWNIFSVKPPKCHHLFMSLYEICVTEVK